MTIDEIIQQWYTVACGGNLGELDIFFKFVAIWVAFNALYTSRHSDEIGDWEQVRSFAGEPSVIDRHRELLQNDHAYRNAVGVLKKRGVYDVRRRTLRRIRDENDLTAVTSCLYQVRCNLFHGGKMPDNPRDEALVFASYAIVSKLIETHASHL
jgi:hypothetical protein